MERQRDIVTCSLTFALALIWIQSAKATLLVEETSCSDQGFTVSVNDVLLMHHSRQRPLVALGKGQFEAVDILGNFNITDTVLTQTELRDYTIERHPDDSVTVTLKSSNSGGGGKNDSLSLDLHLSEPENGTLLVDPIYRADDHSSNLVYLRLPSTEDESIWGGGEQYSYLNLRGRTYPIWVREQGVGRNKSSPFTRLMDRLYSAGGDYHTTYWPQATYLSSRRYYFELPMPTYSELRFDSDPAGHTIYWHKPSQGEPCGPQCTLKFVVGDSFMEIVQNVNPGAPALPEWVHQGAILGVQGGTEKMLSYLKQADDEKAAISGLWIQDWSGKITTEFGTRVFWNWQWNQTWYPDLDQVIRDLKARDVGVLAYITPHLNVDGNLFMDNRHEEFWIKDEQGKTLQQDFGEFTVATADIIEPDPNCNCVNPARHFYKNLMQTNLLDLGLSGWMADFGEYLPLEATTRFPGRWWGDRSGQALHQTLSQDWASLNRELLEESGRLGEVIFFMRSGGVRSKFHQTMSWAGDQTVDWTQSDGLKSSIVAALSLACQGMGLSHSDIGGYTSTNLGTVGVGLKTRSRELLLRWAEYAAFTPMMRTHEGNQPEHNHQVYTDRDTMRRFARLTRIFARLADYRRAAVARNRDEGIPVMAPLFLYFEQDAETHLQEYEYMFGEDLLVAPVTEPEVNAWEVYLPAGADWVWLWDEKEMAAAGQAYIAVNATLGKPPVFYRQGSAWTHLFREIRKHEPL